MNKDLLRYSLAYHGKALLDQMQEEQINADIDQSLIDKISSVRPINSDSFSKKLTGFIARKADLLFDVETSKVNISEQSVESNQDRYAVLPALEYFMSVPSYLCRKHFYESLERDQVLICVVTSVDSDGLQLNVLTTESKQVRWIEHLKISAYCSVREIPRSLTSDNTNDPLESFNNKDLVRVFIKSVTSGMEDRTLSVSMRDRLLTSPLPPHLKLGLIADEDLPAYYRTERTLDDTFCTYGRLLEETLAFNNPRCVSNLSLDLIGCSTDQSHSLSLMRGLFRMTCDEEESREALRKHQTHRLAMKSVERGVVELKEGRSLEAMQMFNKALQIEKTNVEALVARGALYANNEGYSRALEDFEEALRIDSGHANAKRYTIQTLLVHSRRFQILGLKELRVITRLLFGSIYSLLETNSVNEADACMKRLALLDPTHPEIKPLFDEIADKRQALARRSRTSGSAARTYSEARDSNNDDTDDDDDDTTIDRAKKKLLKSLQKDESRGRKRKRGSCSSGDEATSLNSSVTSMKGLNRSLSSTTTTMRAPEFGTGKYYGPLLPPQSTPASKPASSKKKKKPARKKRDTSSSSSSSSSSSGESDAERRKVKRTSSTGIKGDGSANRPIKVKSSSKERRGQRSNSRAQEKRRQRSNSRDRDRRGQRSNSRGQERRGQRSNSRNRDKRGQRSKSRDREKRGQRSNSRTRDRRSKEADRTRHTNSDRNRGTSSGTDRDRGRDRETSNDTGRNKNNDTKNTKDRARREALEDMENFLKQLKQNKKLNNSITQTSK